MDGIKDAMKEGMSKRTSFEVARERSAVPYYEKPQKWTIQKLNVQFSVDGDSFEVTPKTANDKDEKATK